jgi:hypothetical protein
LTNVNKKPRARIEGISPFILALFLLFIRGFSLSVLYLKSLNRRKEQQILQASPARKCTIALYSLFIIKI